MYIYQVEKIFCAEGDCICLKTFQTLQTLLPEKQTFNPSSILNPFTYLPYTFLPNDNTDFESILYHMVNMEKKFEQRIAVGSKIWPAH